MNKRIMFFSLQIDVFNNCRNSILYIEHTFNLIFDKISIYAVVCIETNRMLEAKNNKIVDMGIQMNIFNCQTSIFTKSLLFLYVICTNLHGIMKTTCLRQSAHQKYLVFKVFWCIFFGFMSINDCNSY